MDPGVVGVPLATVTVKEALALEPQELEALTVMFPF
jgi:hypothetical protein